MPLKKNQIIYLITSGKSTAATTPATNEFSQIVRLVETAVTAGVDLIQLREKNLNALVLYELTSQCAGLTEGTSTCLLVNDRADIAAAAGADGVHLTTGSIPTTVVRKTFGEDFLIGVSTHTVAEISGASTEGADFAVFGPVFATKSKLTYGDPVGLDSLRQVVAAVKPFPVLALGGIVLDRISDCVQAGAAGIAGIGLFEERSTLPAVVERIRQTFPRYEQHE
jgi:thiamine-phosphate pyrophosphorylase